MQTKQSFKVKSSHGWFNNGLTLHLTYNDDGEKVIRFMYPGKDEKECVLFESTNPEHIRTLFMFTGTSKYSIYYLEVEKEMQQAGRRLEKKWPYSVNRKPTKEEKDGADKDYAAFYAKYEEKANNIREWIYSYPLNPGIKMVKEFTCGCNMGHCSALLGIEPDSMVYNTLGELFALFSYGKSIPCYSSCEAKKGKECTCDIKESDDDPWYEHPDSVLLYLEKVDKDKIYEIYPDGCYSNKIVHVNLMLTEEETKYTLMSWSYGR